MRVFIIIFEMNNLF